MQEFSGFPCSSSCKNSELTSCNLPARIRQLETWAWKVVCWVAWFYLSWTASHSFGKNNRPIGLRIQSSRDIKMTTLTIKIPLSKRSHMIVSPYKLQKTFATFTNTTPSAVSKCMVPVTQIVSSTIAPIFPRICACYIEIMTPQWLLNPKKFHYSFPLFPMRGNTPK